MCGDCDVVLTAVTSYDQLPMPNSDNSAIILNGVVSGDNTFGRLHSRLVPNHGLAEHVLDRSDLGGQQAKLVRVALQTYVVKSYGKQRDGSTTQSAAVTTFLLVYLEQTLVFVSCWFSRTYLAPFYQRSY